jgi:uncharacterized membrane protein YfcA
LQVVSQGFALALVAPGSVIALATYAHAGVVDWHVGVALAIGGIAAVPVGVSLAHRLPETRLKRLFVGLIVVAAAILAFKH